MKLRNIVFPQSAEAPTSAPPKLWDVSLVDGVIGSVDPAAADDGDSDIVSQLLLPPLCHPHLHLDKAYLLTSQSCCSPGEDSGDGGDDDLPSYSDLLPRAGSFAEALHTTAAAKARFTAADLRRRGLQLLATSCAQGVTSARVFIEVDAQAAGGGATALAVAHELQALFRGRLVLQVCAFAQEVLFTGAAGAANRAAMEAALQDDEKNERRTIEALGTTPYVEATRAQSLQNIEWAVATALRHGLHLDVHLDYTLADPDAQEPLVFALLDALVRQGWPARQATTQRHPPRTVVVGHATQLTRLAPARLRQLADTIRAHALPVYFVGLPTSDLYMMGRRTEPEADSEADSHDYHTHPRGTLPVPALVRRYGLRACLGANNVGNAFTPHGTGDPLQLACWGVGLYHAGTGPDAQLLYGSVSWLAREAIGLGATGGGDGDGPEEGPLVDGGPDDGFPQRLVGRPVGRVLAVANMRYMPMPAADASDPLSRIPARPRLGFRDVVWDPPEPAQRTVI